MAAKRAPAAPGYRRCPQCLQDKLLFHFISRRSWKLITWCSSCRDLYRGGGSARSRRVRIDQAGELHVTWVRSSHAQKIDGLPASYSSGTTCPKSCKLRDAGCFAEFGQVGAHWKNVPRDGLDFSDFLFEVRALRSGQLWRHNIAGDLPGEGDYLDLRRLEQLVQANQGRRGFTYTHKPLLTAAALKAVARANQGGFTINLSADSLEDADAKAELGVGPVVVTVPSDTRRSFLTPAGRRVVICPAETHRINCERCQLCAKPQRKSIVGFAAHGQWKAKIDGRLRLPVVQQA